jgi:3-oxoadipate enol-lactonase
MPTIEVPGARLAFDAVGKGDPILFLHGVGSVRGTWAGQLEEFGGRNLAIALDARGHGDSVARADTISMESFASDTAAVVDALGAGHAHVCGLSMGGVIALHVWRDHPEVVHSLILCDTWAWHPSAAAGQDGRLEAIDAEDMSRLARDRMPGVYGPGAGPDLVQRGVDTFAAKDKAAYRQSSAVLWTVDLRSVAASVTVPTLILVGEHDTVTPPELSEELQRLIPGSLLVVIPDSGHLTNEENPAAFNAALREFLERV